ncbi:DUF6783 domain-containing protein [Enterocloster sp.]|uniref:DUF6783 domain-containing protein n=1 Tax=Enterocloster sp. TaxID=2719315 RepID=UPI0039968B16
MALILPGYTAKWGVQMAGMNFQICSEDRYTIGGWECQELYKTKRERIPPPLTALFS